MIKYKEEVAFRDSVPLVIIIWIIRLARLRLVFRQSFLLFFYSSTLRAEIFGVDESGAMIGTCTIGRYPALGNKKFLDSPGIPGCAIDRSLARIFVLCAIEIEIHRNRIPAKRYLDVIDRGSIN